MEEWKKIPETNNRYEISNLGNVRNSKSHIVLKQIKSKSGYMNIRVHLGSRDKTYTFTVHRLVANAFIPNLNNSPEVNHKDGNKHNNCVSNLEWCTKSENEKHAHRTGLKDGRKAIERLAALNSKSVAQLKDGCVLTVYCSASDAGRKTGICPSSITKVCRHERKVAGGYVWEYI